MAKQFQADTALAMVFSPMRGIPTVQADASVTTSSALLFADATKTDGNGARRIRIYNTDAAATIGLFFIAAAGTATGLTIANSMKVGPGMTFECVIASSIRIAAVSSSGTVTVNCLVHDLV